MSGCPGPAVIRRRIYVLLEKGSVDTKGIAINFSLVTLIFGTLATTPDSLRSLSAEYQPSFQIIELIATVFFPDRFALSGESGSSPRFIIC